jgi:hypothetical protein
MHLGSEAGRAFVIFVIPVPWASFSNFEKKHQDVPLQLAQLA